MSVNDSTAMYKWVCYAFEFFGGIHYYKSKSRKLIFSLYFVMFACFRNYYVFFLFTMSLNLFSLRTMYTSKSSPGVLLLFNFLINLGDCLDPGDSNVCSLWERWDLFDWNEHALWLYIFFYFLREWECHGLVQWSDKENECNSSTWVKKNIFI